MFCLFKNFPLLILKVIDFTSGRVFSSFPGREKANGEYLSKTRARERELNRLLDVTVLGECLGARCVWVLFMFSGGAGASKDSQFGCHHAKGCKVKQLFKHVLRGWPTPVHRKALVGGKASTFENKKPSPAYPHV